MNDLLIYLAFDIFSVFLISLILVRRYTLYHPLTIYLFFHIYSVTIRLIEVSGGAETMYSSSLAYSAITIDEIVRAALFADIALISFSFGTVLFDTFKRDNNLKLYISISNRIYIWVMFLCMPLGLLAFIFFRAGDASGGYIATIAQWPICLLLLGVFIKGFRWYLLLPIIFYLSYVGLQGYHRFMLVLPLIFLFSYHLMIHNKKWPSFKTVILGSIFILLFPQLKYIGSAFQDGDFNELQYRVELAFGTEESDDLAQFKGQFLDQFAGALTMTDRKGEFLYGSSLLPILTLPVPRALWPEKPGIGDHVIAIATADRPYDVQGRIITYIGEAYMNFGIYGVILVPFILSVFLTKFYHDSCSGVVNKLNRYIYLVVFSSLIQVFRDGLSSFIMFALIPNMPIILFSLLHLFFKRRLLIRNNG